MSRLVSCIVMLPTLVLLLFVSAADADLSDFTQWTPAADPAHPSFTSSATPTQANLFAGTDPIPSGTDIGFQSTNGNTVSSSTAGYAFSHTQNLSIAIDFDLSFVSAGGGLGLGFGIGEEGTGENSAGVGMVTIGGSPLLVFAGAARVNDVTQPPAALALAAGLTGSMFVSYDTASGDIIVGAAAAPGAAAPTATATFAGLQNQ